MLHSTSFQVVSSSFPNTGRSNKEIGRITMFSLLYPPPRVGKKLQRLFKSVYILGQHHILNKFKPVLWVVRVMSVVNILLLAKMKLLTSKLAKTLKAFARGLVLKEGCAYNTM